MKKLKLEDQRTAAQAALDAWDQAHGAQLAEAERLRQETAAAYGVAREALASATTEVLKLARCQQRAEEIADVLVREQDLDVEAAKLATDIRVKHKTNQYFSTHHYTIVRSPYAALVQRVRVHLERIAVKDDAHLLELGAAYKLADRRLHDANTAKGALVRARAVLIDALADVAEKIVARDTRRFKAERRSTDQTAADAADRSKASVVFSAYATMDEARFGVLVNNVVAKKDA